MIPFLVLSLVASVPEGDLNFDEREPILLLVLKPSAAALPTFTTEELTEAAALALARQTNFKLLSESQSGLSRESIAHCSGDNTFACWAEVAGPHLLMVVSVFGDMDPNTNVSIDQCSTVLFDTRALARLSQGIDRTAPDATARLEDLAYLHAVKLTPREPIASGGLDAYFDRLIRQDFHEILATSRQAVLPGMLSLQTREAGLEIWIDGSLAGATRAGVTRVRGVSAGHRTVVLKSANGEVSRAEVDVRSGEISRFEVKLPMTGNVERDDASIKTALRFGGGGLLLTGAVLFAYAIAASPSAEAGFDCLDSDCMRTRARFSRFCDYGEGRSCSALGRIFVFPLATSLTLLGGSALLESDLNPFEETPWLVLGLGIGSSVLLYALSAIAGGASAF